MPTAERIAFVCPRFAQGATVGGAETLLKHLATRAALAGRQVTFLTTCATNHFTWQNDVPAGIRRIEGMDVHFFPVDDDRDLETFFQVQNTIVRRRRISPEEEELWLRHNVNSTPLYDHLREHGDDYDAIVTGPYLFGLVFYAALIHPAKTILVPCLHDEPFAYLEAFKRLFSDVGRIAFNAEPERELAEQMFTFAANKAGVVGIGLPPLPPVDPLAFAAEHGLTTPYVVYCGRREALKGTPLLLDYLTAFRERTQRDVRLVLTGTGSVDPPQALAPYILDVGLVSEEEKLQAMAGAVAFCHPSVNESLGIVILESFLMETPALVHAGSKVLAYQCRESRGGLWFENYPEFEEALTLLLDNKALGHAMGQNGRRYVEQAYSLEALDERLFGVLDV